MDQGGLQQFDNLFDFVLGFNAMWNHDGEFRRVKGWCINFILGISLLPFDR